MTLIIAAKGKRSIWLAADNRLTYLDKKFTDSGCKIFNYDCKDARSIIGYCGLGMTNGGVQPSEWLEKLFRGAERSWIDGMHLLCQSSEKLLPHLHNIGSTHAFLIPTLENKVPRLYEIDVNNTCARLISLKENATSRGSGSQVLRMVSKNWKNCIKKLINGYEFHGVSADAVMSEISNLFYLVGEQCNTVSKTCDIKFNDKAIGGTSQLQYLAGKPIAHSVIRGVGNGISSSEMGKALSPIIQFFIENQGTLEVPVEVHDKVIEGLRNMDNAPDASLN